MNTPYCECGRKILIHPHPVRNPHSDHRWKRIKDHDLCARCFRVLMAQQAQERGA